MHKIDSMTKGIALIFGGAILGGGGGGSCEEAKKILTWTLEQGPINVLDPTEVDQNTIVITVALVGPPSSVKPYPQAATFIQSVEMLLDNFDKPIGGIITNENGGYASINGFCQSAALEIPIIDLTCNGRAHPLGLMGSMGLQRLKEYQSYQVGLATTEKENSLLFTGDLGCGSHLMVGMADKLDAMIAVARNPVELDYALDFGAPRALSFALKLGQTLIDLTNKGGEFVAQKAAMHLKGKFHGTSLIAGYESSMSNGLDQGSFYLPELKSKIFFCNEYLTLDTPEGRGATFPDLITLFDNLTGWPVGASEIREGMEVSLLTVNRLNLPLGVGAKDLELLRQLEVLTRLPLII